MNLSLAAIPADVKQSSADVAIPEKPSVLSEVLRAYPKPEKVAALIAQNSTVSEKVLDVINGSGVTVARPIEKIEQAVMMLGVGSVVNIVYAVALHAALDIDADHKLLPIWKNATDTAAAAGILANELTGVKAEDAYLLGLFRDCGIPLLHRRYPTYLVNLERGYSDHAARILMTEDQKFGTNHALVGQQLAQAWELPAVVVQAVAQHHSHRRLMCEGKNQIELYADRLCATLKIAEHVTRAALVYGKSVNNPEWEIYKKSILKLIDKPAQEILDVANSIVATLRQSDSLF